MISDIKSKLYDLCKAIVEEKFATISKAIEEAQSAANSETKSTAGDKHDTSRAMMQLEVEQKSKQLAEARKLKQALSQIDPSHSHEAVQLGSVVFTTSANYFVSISAGKLDIENEMFFAVSAVSPIGQAMLGKKKGEEFSFNGRTFTINSVC